MKLNEIVAKYNLDWYAIRNCGQIFVDPICDNWVEAQIKNYFDLDTDYDAIKNYLSQFPELAEPIKAGFGIRILRQPFTQCIISFIISANNNIKRFSKTLSQIDFSNLDKYTEKDFIDLGCGYRAPYLTKAVKQIAELHFETLNKLPNEELRKELLKITGVGRKVADCVMLFAFHRLDVAPVDTWISKAQAKGIDFSKYGKYSGVAQQYIFYFLQHKRRESEWINTLGEDAVSASK